MIEIEVYGVPVESRTLPAGGLAMVNRPQKILYKISYKDYNL